MIHYMGGGVLSEYGSYTFVKAVFDADEQKRPYWFVAEFDVDEGDRVLAPYGAAGLGKPATVVKVERNVSGQVAPVPPKRARRLINKLTE